MIDTTAYTIGLNRPLTHARILWQFIDGAVTATGTDGDLARNDFTFQRWALADGANDWTLQTAADARVDCLFIAAHNLAGATVTVATSAATTGGFTTRATVAVADNAAICVLFNTPAGAAHVIRRLRLTANDGAGRFVGIIRAGVALQMAQTIYGGHGPLTLNRQTVTRQSLSETGQWIGRMIQRRAIGASYTWEHLPAPWYRDQFEPFARTLPGAPFGLAGNPASMADDVGWCWTDQDPAPVNMGIRNFMAVTLPVTGFY